MSLDLQLKIREKTEERARLINESREMIERAEEAGRDLTPEEDTRYEKLFGDAQKLRSSIDRLEKLIDVERETREYERLTAGNQVEKITNPENREALGDKDSPETRVAQAFDSYLRYGFNEMTPEDRKILRETRDLTQGTNSEGGFIVPAEQFRNALIKAIDDQVVIRQHATKFQMVGAKAMKIPNLSADPEDSTWTTEIATVDEDTQMAFGQKSLDPNPMAKLIKVSNTLLRNGSFDVENLVRSRLAYKNAITQEKAYLTGDGSGNPEGVFDTTTIGTGRDTAFASATVISADEWREAKYSLKEGYLARARWIMHRTTALAVSKLKDSDNQYLWQQGLAQGDPDTLLGLPLHLSEYVGNTYTTGQYVAVLGDFSYYWILDELALQIRRIDELYAETDQVGFISRYEGDGKPVLDEAFARLKMG